MNITIIGATGRVGWLVLEQASAAGHTVTALARNVTRLPPAVRAISIDLAATDRAALESGIAGSDAVLSCLGPSSRAEIGIAAAGTATIVEAMRAVGSRRLVAISAAPVAARLTPGQPALARDREESFVMRAIAVPLINRVFSKQYADLAAMERAIRASGLDWTILRPPRLTDKSSHDYRITIGHNTPHGRSISRDALARAMLCVLDNPDTIQNPVGVAEQGPAGCAGIGGADGPLN